MQLDPARIADTRSWLTKVNTDIRAAETDLGAQPPILEDLMFHCQQAVEKALKALLTWHDIPFRRTHDLTEIGTQCVQIDPTLGPLLPRASTLTEHAWQYRYPGPAQEPTLEEATGALALAREVVDAIRQRLPAETHP